MIDGRCIQNGPSLQLDDGMVLLWVAGCRNTRIDGGYFYARQVGEPLRNLCIIGGNPVEDGCGGMSILLARSWD